MVVRGLAWLSADAISLPRGSIGLRPLHEDREGSLEHLSEGFRKAR